MEDGHLTFMHGLANKPAPAESRGIWLDALCAVFVGGREDDKTKRLY